MTAEQLKNSILQMAVSGKLVPQDPNDEPASVLLDRIRKEKEQLIREGKIKKEKNPSYIFRGADNTPYEKVGNNEPVSIADEVPFEIPESWEWCRLSNLVVKEIKRGKSPTYIAHSGTLVFAQKCNVKTGGIDMSLAKCLDEKTLGKYPVEEFLQDCDIVINSTGTGTMGRIGVFHDSDNPQGLPIVPDSHVTIVRLNAAISVEYIVCCLKYYQQYLEEQGEGSTNQKELKPDTIKNLFIPLPPLPEQYRIAEKLISIDPLVISYGKNSNNLFQLNNDFPNQLKKSVLQQAIQGKLVPQDPNEEPASALLERIRAEKERLIAEGKIKREKNESVIYRRDNSHYEKLDGVERCIDNEVPFEIPDSWAWSRLKNLVYLTSGGQFPESENGCLYVKVADMNLPENSLEIVTSTRKTKVFDTGNIPVYSIIFPKRGGAISTNKKRVVMNEPICIDSNTMSMTVFLPNIFDYLRMWFEGIDLGALQSGTSVPQINNKDLEPLLIPVPPIEEQSRIVFMIREALTWIEQM